METSSNTVTAPAPAVRQGRSGARIALNILGVLVLGAGGGVGSYGVQIARASGAHVTGVCSTRKVAMVKSLGAHEIVDYTVADFTGTYD